ncbi:hypothetical protein BD311DRAFT_693598 [Dichomitus squalens]|uniref:B-related factor 1 n=1 Tax=Dichomitus squalens TaxID=114155 RepID=A0A4Q9MPX0_9APHY|nr:hypothetical protein BD311DRAFT_693598 [Dichomitus squalens]
MSGRCEECGASTVWDTDVGSAICLQCGTLADPTQSVLASHLENTDVSGREYAPWANIPGGSTLRGRNGWALSGQGKESRDRKNTIAMHEFIRTIATRLSNPGLTTRAQGVFDQAMRLGEYRWGRKAKLTAGAALAIALRESHKSDSIRDIAYLLDEPPVAISRAFTKVIALLQLGLSTTDPAVHLPVLQTYLVSLLNGSGGAAAALPAQLVKVLSPLIPRFPSVIHTATALSSLLARTHTFAHLPTAPTACALFMLALEAELSSSLPNAGAFAPILGARLGAGKGVVMQRYKHIYDLVEEWIREVPWLDAHERKRAKGREGEGRSKVAKRVVVARGLKDVVRFQEEIWRKRVEHEGRPLVRLELDEKDAGASGSGDERDGSEAGGRSPRGTSVLGDDTPPRKKAKPRHPRTVVDASQFLLNPLSTAISSPPPVPVAGPPDLLTHLLTADASSLPHAFACAPTRLQLLASARGGTEERHITDEELFAEDELEGLMRSPEEAEAVRIAMGWDVESDDEEHDGGNVPVEKSSAKGKKRKRKSPAGEDVDAGNGSEPRGSKKINMEALARLLNPDGDFDVEAEDGVGGPEIYSRQVSVHEGDDEEGEEWDEDGEEEIGVGSYHEAGNVQHGAAGEEVVGEWRPPSPGGGHSEDWFEF